MIQTLIVAVIVIFCLWQVAKRWLPQSTVRHLDAPANACGSGGCDTCGACKAVDFGELTPREPRLPLASEQPGLQP